MWWSFETKVSEIKEGKKGMGIKAVHTVNRSNFHMFDKYFNWKGMQGFIFYFAD